MTISEKIKMIDEFLEEPNSHDPKWIELMQECRRLLIRDEQQYIDAAAARFERGAFGTKR